MGMCSFKKFWLIAVFTTITPFLFPTLAFGDYINIWDFSVSGEGGGNDYIKVRNTFNNLVGWNFSAENLELKYQIHYYVNYNSYDDDDRTITVRARLYEDDFLNTNDLMTPTYDEQIYGNGLGNYTSGLHYYIGPNGWIAKLNGRDGAIVGRSSSNATFSSIGYFTWTLSGPNWGWRQGPEFFAAVYIDDGDAGSEEFFGDIVFNKDVPWQEPTFTVTNPDSGDTWATGETKTISWNSSWHNDPVKLLYSTNGGSSFASINSSTSDDGSYSWNIPSGISSNNCIVRVITATSGYNYAPRGDSDIFAITSSSYPDLIVQSPSVSDSIPNTGQSFTISATVKNQGSGSSASTTLRYYLSTDSTISTGDTPISTDGVSALSFNDTSSESDSVTAPTTAGTYWVGACVDSVSGESNTGNNCSSGVQITVPSNSYPDLIVQSPSVSDSTPNTGQSFTISATVKNQGSGSSASTTLRYYRSTDSTISTGDTPISTDGVSALSFNGTSSESDSVTAPTTAGTYWIGACVDPVSDESNTGNNCSSGVQITVSSNPPLLAVTSPNGGESWERGTTHNITWSSSGNVGSAINILLFDQSGNGDHSFITSSTLNNGSYSWTVPSSQTIRSDYRIKINSISNVSISDFSNSNFSIILESDTASPDTSITSGPSGTITTQDFTFNYTGTDKVTSASNLVYSHRLNDQDSNWSWSNYTSSTLINYYNRSNGSYTFNVRTRDEAGNVDTSPATRSFTVNLIIPSVNFAINQEVSEGSEAIVMVSLNGNPIEYPVLIPYVVGGDATNPDDHNAVSGQIEITSGLTGELNIQIVADEIPELRENITFTMQTPTNAVLGSKSEHIVVIAEGNFAPVVSLRIEQTGMLTRLIDRSGGPVTLTAVVDDQNQGDEHHFTWSIDGAEDVSQLVVQADSFPQGPLRLAVTVTDNGEPSLSNFKEVFVTVIGKPLILSPSEDTDGDGISDFDEGFGDDDMDGVPNYLDADNELNVLRGKANQFTKGLIVADIGVKLELGEYAVNKGDFVAAIGSVPSLGIEEGLFFFPGLFDLRVSGLISGQSAWIVMPLLYPIRIALYRLFSTEDGWQDFEEDEHNKIYSAPGVVIPFAVWEFPTGVCPEPGHADYQLGLNEGYACLMLLVEDGGPNDADHTINGQISLLSGIETSIPGGCSLSKNGEPNWSIPMLLFLSMFYYSCSRATRWRRRNRSEFSL